MAVEHQRPNITRESLIERAKEMVPDLQARAARADEIRRIPEDTQRELMDAGLYRVYLPSRFGGYEMDQMIQVDLAAELGRGCGSTAWVHAVVASHSWMHGMFEEQAQDEVWKQDSDALISGSTPTGDAKVDAVEGGFVLNGSWTFASGVDVCDWNHFNMFTPREDGAGMEHRYGLAHKSDFEVIDDWYTTGLRGTGSKSMRCRDLFIPEYRTLRSETCRGEATPGSAVNPHPIYRMPLFSLFGKGIVAPAVGIARGALDIVVAQVTERRIQAGAKLAEQQSAQIRVAEAAAEIEAAWTLLGRDCVEVHARAEAGEVPTLEERARWRPQRLVYRQHAGPRRRPADGAAGRRRQQRKRARFSVHWRDMHTLASHIALAWDAQGANYGRILYGLPSADPKI